MEAWVAAYLKRALSWMNLRTELIDWHQHQRSFFVLTSWTSVEPTPHSGRQSRQITAEYAPQHERCGLRRMSGLEEPEKLRERQDPIQLAVGGTNHGHANPHIDISRHRVHVWRRFTDPGVVDISKANVGLERRRKVQQTRTNVNPGRASECASGQLQQQDSTPATTRGSEAHGRAGGLVRRWLC